MARRLSLPRVGDCRFRLDGIGAARFDENTDEIFTEARLSAERNASGPIDANESSDGVSAGNAPRISVPTTRPPHLTLSAELSSRLRRDRSRERSASSRFIDPRANRWNVTARSISAPRGNHGERKRGVQLADRPVKTTRRSAKLPTYTRES